MGEEGMSMLSTIREGGDDEQKKAIVQKIMNGLIGMGNKHHEKKSESQDG